jgi:GNAT superfamily N-acetyltransferase
MDPQIVRYSEQPELWDAVGDLLDDVWPEYNVHGEELNYYWRQLYDVFPEWQFLLVDPEDQTILAEGHTIPLAWDGTDEDLGPGIDATIAGAFALRAAGGQPTAVSAMAAEIAPRHQGKGLAPVMLRAMAALTREAGLAHLIAPVRPSHKDRYPAIPIERYAHWVRDDASPGPGCASPKPATTSSPRAWPGSASTGSRTPASTGNPTSGSSTRSEARDRSAPSALHRYR